MAKGFVIVVGSGRIGNSGVAEDHPAFTESAAIASIPFFMEELRTDITNFTVEDLGEVTFVTDKPAELKSKGRNL